MNSKLFVFGLPKVVTKVHFWDIDGTLVDSSHRYRDLPCGKIDLEYWKANCVPEQIDKDTLLPLAKQYKKDLQDNSTAVIIATARLLQASDYEYIEKYLGNPHAIISRLSDGAKDHELKECGILRLFNEYKKLAEASIKKLFDDKLSNLTMARRLNIQPVLATK